MYRTNFTQNFLSNRPLVEDLISSSSINSNDIVYDIGAGHGIITEVLAKVAKKVIALEPDVSLATKLFIKFADTPNVEIINKDFLKVNLIKENFKVFSNIPFNITSEILIKLAFDTNQFTEGYLVVQKEAADKPMLKLILENLFSTQIYHQFIPSDFNPKPGVKTVLFHLQKKDFPEVKNISLFNDFVAYAYTTNQPNIEKILKKIFTTTQTFKLLKTNHILASQKPSELSLLQWKNVYTFYEQNQNIIPTKVAGSFSKYQTQALNLKKLNQQI